MLDAQPTLTRLKATHAARRFLAFCQDEQFVGERAWGGPKGLWQVYLWHCQEEDLLPLPENVLAEALGKIARRKLASDWSSGKRRRYVTYTVPLRRKVA